MDPYVIPTAKVLERLRFENPWWKTHAINDAFLGLKRRLYFELFFPLVEDKSVKRTLILMGPRRVGKTVMMHHAIQQLLEQGITPASIFFVAVDNPLYVNMGLEELLQLATHAAGRSSLENNYVFFDEIQYLPDWERHLKVLTDSYPRTKFIVSGSAAAALKVKSSESGAGRFHDFMLPPLTFYEFIHLQGLQHFVQPTEVRYAGRAVPFFRCTDIKAFNELFFDYLNFGGYPEIILNPAIKKDMPGFIKSDIIDKVLLRDLPGLYGIKNVQELNRFFTYLAYNTGREFAPQKIAKDSGLKMEEVKRYLEYLEAAFLIRVVYKVDENARFFKRVTGFKVFLTNPSLRTALFSPLSPTDDEAGNIVETAIYAQWMHRETRFLHYAKWKMGRGEGEVDMLMLNKGTLKPTWAAEVKWSNRYLEKPGELKSLLSFCQHNQLQAALITTIDKQDQIKYQETELHYYPASLYAYAMGERTFRLKEQESLSPLE